MSRPAAPADPLQGQAAGEDGGSQVRLQKIYLRDASVEVPHGPLAFTGALSGEWRPAVDVDLNMSCNDLDDGGREVVVRVAVTAKQGDSVAYIVEVQQAGVFRLSGFADADQRRQVLGTYCPAVLFPYAREAVAELVSRAGFPHFLLQPVNFDALYRAHVEGAGAAARH